MKYSTIFTKAEMESIEKRIKGDKTDITGIFAARVKPKIQEMLEWFNRRHELKRLIRVKAPASSSKKPKEARHSSQA